MARMKVGNGQDANYWIIQCLSTGEKTFGKIRKFLKSKGIRYKDNKGLSLRLDDLISKGIIIKHKSRLQQYPIYLISTKQLEKIDFLASIFESHVSRKLLKFEISDERDFVKNTIQRCGFYIFYTILQGLKLSLHSKYKRKPMKVLNDWFENALPMRFAPTHFHLQMSSLLDPTGEYGFEGSPFSHPKLRKIKINHLEKILGIVYPEEMKICTMEMKNLKTNAKNAMQIKQKVVGSKQKRKKRH